MVLSYAETNTISKWTETRFYMTYFHLGVLSGVSKMISKLTVCSEQTMHLSWMKISTISKRTETSFHLSLVTQEYHSVHPKQFSEPMVCLGQIVHLSCTETNTISKKDRKEILHVARHLGVPSGASKNGFWSYGTFGANCGSILHRD
jgi:hypothetical protein